MKAMKVLALSGVVSAIVSGTQAACQVETSPACNECLIVTDVLQNSPSPIDENLVKATCNTMNISEKSLNHLSDHVHAIKHGKEHNIPSVYTCNHIHMCKPKSKTDDCDHTLMKDDQKQEVAPIVPVTPESDSLGVDGEYDNSHRLRREQNDVIDEALREVAEAESTDCPHACKKCQKGLKEADEKRSGAKGKKGKKGGKKGKKGGKKDKDVSKPNPRKGDDLLDMLPPLPAFPIDDDSAIFTEHWSVDDGEQQISGNTIRFDRTPDSGLAGLGDIFRSWLGWAGADMDAPEDVLASSTARTPLQHLWSLIQDEPTAANTGTEPVLVDWVAVEGDGIVRPRDQTEGAPIFGRMNSHFQRKQNVKGPMLGRNGRGMHPRFRSMDTPSVDEYVSKDGPDNGSEDGSEDRPPRPDNGSEDGSEDRPPRPDQASKVASVRSEDDSEDRRPPRPDNGSEDGSEDRPPRPDNGSEDGSEDRPPRPDNGSEDDSEDRRPPRPDNGSEDGSEDRPPRPDQASKVASVRSEDDSEDRRPPRPDDGSENDSEDRRPPRPDNGSEDDSEDRRPPRPDHDSEDGSDDFEDDFEDRPDHDSEDGPEEDSEEHPHHGPHHGPEDGPDSDMEDFHPKGGLISDFIGRVFSFFRD